MSVVEITEHPEVLSIDFELKEDSPYNRTLLLHHIDQYAVRKLPENNQAELTLACYRLDDVKIIQESDGRVWRGATVTMRRLK